jgi:hypothetical protein
VQFTFHLADDLVMRPRVFRSILAALLFAGFLAGCSGDSGPTAPRLTPRTYEMGFSAFPPRPDLSLALQTIDLWSRRADAALILNEPPWDSLLAGRSPDSLIRNNQLGLANYYRAKGLRIVVSIDPTNGLDRSSDAAALVQAGRSLTEPVIQALFRGYATAMDTLLHPDYISVASETNLIRVAAPTSLYNAVVATAAGAADDIRARDAQVKIFTTVQVEVAWGALPPGGPYVGIAQDRADFGFAQAVGLSSYPYLGGFADPDSIPLDYYSRLVEGDPLPELVIEGGWSSDSTTSANWNLESQRRYIARHARILDRAGAIGWFQITFTDLDVAALGLPPGAQIFASLGLVDTDLQSKPALSEWDAVFARPRR